MYFGWIEFMRKKVMNAAVMSLIAGAIGGLLRYFYLTRAVEPDTGLPVLGSAPHLALVIFTVFVVLLVLATSYITGKYFSMKNNFRDIIAPVNTLYRVTTGISALLIFVAGVMGIVPAINGGSVSYSALIQAVLIALAGAALIGMSHEFSGVKPLRGAYAFSIIPEIAVTFWLLIYYRTTQINPTMLTYVFRSLALAASVFAFYFTAASVYGRNATARFMFSHCAAIYFLIMSLADSITVSNKLCFAGLALYFTVNLSRFIANLIPRKKPQQTAKSENT